MYRLLSPPDAGPQSPVPTPSSSSTESPTTRSTDAGVPVPVLVVVLLNSQLHQTPHQLLMRHRPGPYAPASLGAMPLSPGLHRVLHSRRLPHRTCSLPRVPSCSRSAFASSGRRDAGHLSPTNCRTFVSCTRARIKLGHYTTHGESNQQPPAPRSMPSREPTQSVVTAATAIGSGGTREPSQRYGLQRLGSRGNREALRTLSSPRYRKTTRSSPTPPPPCGGIPWRIESM